MPFTNSCKENFAILEPKSDKFVFKFLSSPVSKTANTKTNFLLIKRFKNSSFVKLSV